MNPTLAILKALGDASRDGGDWLLTALLLIPIWIRWLLIDRRAKVARLRREAEAKADSAKKQSEKDSWSALTARFPNHR